MTVEEVVALAQEHGLDEEALAMISGQPNGIAALNVAIALGLPADAPIETPFPQAPGPTQGDTFRDPKPGEEEAEQSLAMRAEIDEIANLVELGDQRSAAQDQRLEEAQGTDAWVQFLKEVQGAQPGEWDGRYDWVYNELGLLPMSLDDDVALLELLPILEEIVGVDVPDELTDAEKASQVKQILARNSKNPAVQLSVREWSRKSGNNLGDMNVLALAQEFPWERALTINATAKQWDLDPLELAEIWKSQEDRTFVGSVAGLERAKARGEDVTQTFTRRPLLEAAAGYKAGLELYNGSKVLAAVHLNDPALAARMQRDPYGLDSGELRRVLDYVGGPEGKEGDPQVSWLVNRLSGAFDSAATVTHDPESVKNAVQTLADAWNMTGSEGVAAAIAGEIVANAVARARASLPNPFAEEVGSPVNVQETIEDVMANVKARFRQLPEYGELFGEKRAGESEEEYVGRFERQSQHILGDDNAAVVRTGMRTGNVNAIYQQALLTDAGESSTRFQEILARNSRILRELL